MSFGPEVDRQAASGVAGAATGSAARQRRSCDAGPRHLPLLDRVTIARLVLEDFDVDEEELEALVDERERWRLEQALRDVVDFEAAARHAVELWRAGR